jgi:hypothetical protein
VCSFEHLDGRRRVIECRLATLEVIVSQDGTASARQNGSPEPVSRQHGLAPDLGSDDGAHELLHALPAAVYTTDVDGYITFYNEAAAAMEAMIRGQLNGDVRFDWRAEGLACQIVLPTGLRSEGDQNIPA